MKIALIFLVLGFSLANADTEHIEKFRKFVSKFGKKYGSLNEQLKKLDVFIQNLKKIDNLNSLFNGSSVFGVTQFSDLTQDEFKEKFLMTGGEIPAFPNVTEDLSNHRFRRQTTPTSYDLRTTGCVNAVRNQEQCGSCWAFATVASLECLYYRKNSRSIDLSEQQLVDCVYPRSGCDGGSLNDAYRYAYNNGGLTTEGNYPYTASYGSCRSYTSYFKPTGTSTFGSSVDRIKSSLITSGVPFVYMDATPLQFYTSGIFTPSYCTSGAISINHAVNIVGYDSENGVNYWIVRNSWGTTWGESGYFRMKIGCGLENYVIQLVA